MNPRKTALRCDNKTGYKGVVKYGKKFNAQYHLNGTTKFIGRFATAEEAGQAYIKTIEELEKKKE